MRATSIKKTFSKSELNVEVLPIESGGTLVQLSNCNNDTIPTFHTVAGKTFGSSIKRTGRNFVVLQ